MLTKISRQTCLKRHENFHQRKYDRITDEEECFYPTIYSNSILTLDAKSVKGKIAALSTELTSLVKQLEIDSLIFLGDTTTPWLYQTNDYKPVKEAIQFLSDNKIGKRFNGALEVGTKSLPAFLRHLLWLTSCNASLPCFYFTDRKHNIMGTLCQYIYLHFDTLNKKTDSRLKEIISKTQLFYLPAGRCYNPFSKTSAIKHRKIVVTG